MRPTFSLTPRLTVIRMEKKGVERLELDMLRNDLSLAKTSKIFGLSNRDIQGDRIEWFRKTLVDEVWSLEAGLRLQMLREHDAVPWQMFRSLREDAEGLYRWPGSPYVAARLFSDDEEVQLRHGGRRLCHLSRRRPALRSKRNWRDESLRARSGPPLAPRLNKRRGDKEHS